MIFSYMIVELLRVGGLRWRFRPPTCKGVSSAVQFGRRLVARRILFSLPCGGPPQHETFDPKPMRLIEMRFI